MTSKRKQCSQCTSNGTGAHLCVLRTYICCIVHWQMMCRKQQKRCTKENTTFVHAQRKLQSETHYNALQESISSDTGSSSSSSRDHNEPCLLHWKRETAAIRNLRLLMCACWIELCASKRFCLVLRRLRRAVIHYVLMHLEYIVKRAGVCVRPGIDNRSVIW